MCPSDQEGREAASALDGLSRTTVLAVRLNQSLRAYLLNKPWENQELTKNNSCFSMSYEYDLVESPRIFEKIPPKACSKSLRCWNFWGWRKRHNIQNPTLKLPSSTSWNIFFWSL